MLQVQSCKSESPFKIYRPSTTTHPPFLSLSLPRFLNYLGVTWRRMVTMGSSMECWIANVHRSGMSVSRQRYALLFVRYNQREKELIMYKYLMRVFLLSSDWSWPGAGSTSAWDKISPVYRNELSVNGTWNTV